MRKLIAALSSAVVVVSAYSFYWKRQSSLTEAELVRVLQSKNISYKAPLIKGGYPFAFTYEIDSPDLNGIDFRLKDGKWIVKAGLRGDITLSTEGTGELTLLTPSDNTKPSENASQNTGRSVAPPRAPSLLFKFDRKASAICKGKFDADHSPGGEPSFADLVRFVRLIDCTAPAGSFVTIGRSDRTLWQSSAPVRFRFTSDPSSPPSPSLRKMSLIFSSSGNVRALPSEAHDLTADELSFWKELESSAGPNSVNFKADYVGKILTNASPQDLKARVTFSAASPAASGWFSFFAQLKEKNGKLHGALKSESELIAGPGYREAIQKSLADLTEDSPSGLSSYPEDGVLSLLRALPEKEKNVPALLNLTPDFNKLGKIRHAAELEFTAESGQDQDQTVRSLDVKVKSAEFSAGKFSLRAKGNLSLSPVPLGSAEIICQPCGELTDSLLSYASEIDNFTTGISGTKIKGSESPPGTLTAERRHALRSFIEQLSDKNGDVWTLKAELNNGVALVGGRTLDELSEMFTKSAPENPRSEAAHPSDPQDEPAGSSPNNMLRLPDSPSYPIEPDTRKIESRPGNLVKPDLKSDAPEESPHSIDIDQESVVPEENSKPDADKQGPAAEDPVPGLVPRNDNIEKAPLFSPDAG